MTAQIPNKYFYEGVECWTPDIGLEEIFDFKQVYESLKPLVYKTSHYCTAWYRQFIATFKISKEDGFRLDEIETWFQHFKDFNQLIEVSGKIRLVKCGSKDLLCVVTLEKGRVIEVDERPGRIEYEYHREHGGYTTHYD